MDANASAVGSLIDWLEPELERAPNSRKLITGSPTGNARVFALQVGSQIRLIIRSSADLSREPLAGEEPKRGEEAKATTTTTKCRAIVRPARRSLLCAQLSSSSNGTAAAASLEVLRAGSKRRSVSAVGLLRRAFQVD